MNRAEKIKVGIADDHAILRSGLKMLINAQPDMEVVGEAQDGEQAIAMVQSRKPNVALLDITMPTMGGLQALGEMMRVHPETRVLVLTMHDDAAYLRSVLAAGASGYVLKRAVDADLLTAIRAVHRGGTFVDPNLAQNLVDDAFRTGNKPHAILSGREMQVLQMVSQGYTGQEIADRIHVSPKTVETYRARITQKLGLRSRNEMVRYALDAGLLSPEKVAKD